ncbi:MAG: methionyl-tRNA formyltransferase, partial [Actinomycetia bacterium]|nr:methionyl-tRNA formyltransferase [Actinomycetes bacterium]
RLCASRHQVAGVVGLPDRRAGRGLKPVPTPVVEKARADRIALRQPMSLTREELSGVAGDPDWDVGVVVAYGGLVPRWLLEEPRYGFVNLHPSLLPRYRGAAPIKRALINGASITGVTTILMSEKIDTGDILLHQESPINDDDTGGTLSERLSTLGARLLVKTLDCLEDERVQGVPQEEEKATYAPPVKAEEGNIDWEQSGESIDRMVRALDPVPGAYTFFRGNRVKIWKTHVTDVPPEDEPGTLMNMGKEGFLVNTGTNCLQVVTVQPEGKRRMSAGEFSRGQRLLIAERFTAGA